MTEFEWLTSDSSDRMRKFLIGVEDAPVSVSYEFSFPRCRGSERKLRLFAHACYHRLRHWFPPIDIGEAAEVAERFADGNASREELNRVHSIVYGLLERQEPVWRTLRGDARARLQPMHEALGLALQLTRPLAVHAAYYAASNAYLSQAAIQEHGDDSRRQEERAQANLLRCIFGNLFQRPQLSMGTRDWRDGVIVNMAQEIYVERAFDRLPILADAMEEAGETTHVLQHLRENKRHVRGCWVLDLILGRF